MAYTLMSDGEERWRHDGLAGWQNAEVFLVARVKRLGYDEKQCRKAAQPQP